MTEQQSLIIADKYKGDVTNEQKIKWLATEVVELGMAYTEDDKKHILEELEDCAFLISHILCRYSSLGIVHHIGNAALKMEKRFKK